MVVVQVYQCELNPEHDPCWTLTDNRATFGLRTATGCHRHPRWNSWVSWTPEWHRNFNETQCLGDLSFLDLDLSELLIFPVHLELLNCSLADIRVQGWFFPVMFVLETEA